MTEKLYYKDSYIKEFSATVLNCEKSDRDYAVVLDKTAFFPEGGGQGADTGKIGEAMVLYTELKEDGTIVHYTDREVPVGETVDCAIHWEKRFRRMQNHTGEHIVSGLIHKKFGMNNVGFHMGSEDVTLDIDGELTFEQIAEIEREANRVAVSNVAVSTYFPDPEMLSNLAYRSKLELTEGVRLVEIEGVDLCACCAPHVKRTGEIGMIKLLFYARYKGGVRIHMLCGFDALDDYNKKSDILFGIARSLSAKPDEADEAVEKLSETLKAEKYYAAGLKKEIISMLAETIPASDGNLCVIRHGFDMAELRDLVNVLLPKCGGICGAFSGSDAAGYTFVIGSKTVPLKAETKKINEALCGRGGGSDVMIQGSAFCTEEMIRAYFERAGE